MDEKTNPAGAAMAVAEAVRDACRAAVAEAWEDAGVQGLCVEGRCEVAVGAIERIGLKGIVDQVLAARHASRGEAREGAARPAAPRAG